MGGGISSGASPPIRKIGSEFPQILQMLRVDESQLNKFVSGQPLLGLSESLGTSFAGGLGNLTGPLAGLMGQAPGLFNSLGEMASSGFGNLLGQTGDLRRNFRGMISPIREGFFGTTAPTIRSGGALTGEENRDVSTATETGFASRGLGAGNQALGSELLNRQQFQQERFSNALNDASTEIGQISGITGQQSGLIGQQAGLLGQDIGQQAGLFGQESGILGGLGAGIQGLQSGALQQLLGPETAAIQGFTSLNDPLLQYASNLFSGNQQSQLQQGIANQNKGAGLIGGAGSAISSILPLLAFSDERIKTKIRETGAHTQEGIPIKTFEYKHNPGHRFMGVIAQDVARVNPHAVRVHPHTGLMMVNRSAIAAPFLPLGPSSLSGSEEGRGERGERIPGSTTSDTTPNLPGAGPTGTPPDMGDPSIEPTPIDQPGGRPSSVASGGDNEGNPNVGDSEFGHAPNLDAFYFGTGGFGGQPTMDPTWWVNYPGVGPVPMAIPLEYENSSDIASREHAGFQLHPV